MGWDGVGSGKVRQETMSASSSEGLPTAQGGEGGGKSESKSQDEPRLSPIGGIRKKGSVESCGVRWISGWMAKLAFMLTFTEISLEWGGAY